MEEIKELEELKLLLETKQYTRLRQKMEEMNTVDIAAALEELEEEDLLKIFRILPKSMAADVFSYLEVDSQQFIITSLSERDAAGIIDNLMADDATDLLEEMPANIVKKLLANANPETRRDINHLLRYPEDSAGSIMTVEYVDLKENMTVRDAVTGSDPDLFMVFKPFFECTTVPSFEKRQQTVVFQVIDGGCISPAFTDGNIIHANGFHIRVVQELDPVVYTLYRIITDLNAKQRKHPARAFIAEKHGYSKYERIQRIRPDL